jgi:hypothetical protein
MTLLVDRTRLTTRRDAAAGPLSPLAVSLARDLEPLLGREPYVPREKARLSRDGGRCPRDGTLLEFDPFSPRRHRCPRCGESYEGEAHYRFWLYWYQLWLAERAVHAALVGALGGGERHLALARAILEGYAGRYLEYPNRDNVLGPTRVFFSTYLESIWLLQLCVAADLLALLGDRETLGLVLDRIVEPSRAIIGGYDEGASNRQVWNAAALLAAARLLGRDGDAERAVSGPSGLLQHLREGLLADGTWYEGENYHLFAHRGLWYGVTMAELAGLPLPAHLVARFEEGFATPFLTALPDLTLPSRRDSQYAISLRQWRFAELCELGLARRDDPRLVGTLQRLYDDDVPRGDTARARSSAEAERNVAPTALSRADLGWRSLLFARPELPPLQPFAPRSVLLPAQGIAVVRRDGGRAYVALDYGSSGGGHGHPDRLDLLLALDDTRWLDDMGTGSYVESSLHWYRSTLAHNAPLVDGRSQERVDGVLRAFEDRGAAGWVSARAAVADGVSVERSVVVMDDYLVDTLEWRADREVTLDLPLHVDAMIDAGGDESAFTTRRIEAAPMPGSAGLEDGFRFLEDTSRHRVSEGATVAFTARVDHASLHGWSACDREAEWWRATAPGAPGAGARGFWIVRARGRSGSIRSVLAWNGGLESADIVGDIAEIALTDGTRHRHRRTPDGWQVEILAGEARSTIELGGLVAAPDDLAPPARRETAAPTIDLSLGAILDFELGEPHYRRSEESWREAGRPSARVRIAREGEALRIDVSVPHSERTFVAAGTENPYDNEPTEINGDGVQLYVQTRAGRSGWILVPEPGGSVRMRPIDRWNVSRAVHASWKQFGDGYALEADLALDSKADGDEIGIALIVNEMPCGRERRRGQLVLDRAISERATADRSAAEFVYLRGDRHDPDRLLRLRFTR